MSNKNLKQLVEQIQKYAIKAPETPQGYKHEGPAPAVAPAPNNGRPTVPTPGQPVAPPAAGRVGQLRSPEIQKMQIAMQRLSRTVSNTIDYDALMQGMNKPETADKSQFQRSFGRDGFSDFMVNRYLRNSAVKGTEFDPGVDKTKMQDKNPSDLKSMFAVLQGLKRIGKAEKEDIADGIWGPRTNNSLKNIAAIAESVEKLGADLGMQAQSFDMNKVGELDKLIPETDKAIDQAEKVKRASVLTVILNGVNSLFLEFRDQVLHNPNYAIFIDKNKPVFEIGATKDKGLEFSGGEEAIYKDLQTNKNQSRFTKDTNGKVVPVASVTIPPDYVGGQKLPPFNITGADLVDKASFENWVNSNSVLMNLMKSNPGTWNNVVSLILNETKKQIANKLRPPAQPTLQEVR